MTGGARRLCRMAAVGAVLAALAACGVPRAHDVGRIDKPAASADDVETIYAKYRSVRNAAVELLDPKPLSTVEAGAVLAVDTGSFEVSQRLNEAESARTGAITVDRVETPRFTKYPLWFFAVVRDDVRDVQRLQIFQRATSVDPWLLVATPEALTTTEVPAVRRGDRDEALTVAGDDARGIAMSPQQAATAYARTLTDPAAAEASSITNDAFVQQMRQAAEANAGVAGAEFSQRWAVDEVEHVLRTEAGGALAFVTLRRTDVYTVGSDRKISWPAGSAQQALLADGIQGGSGQLDYYHQIAVLLPPGQAKPRAIAQFGGVVRGTVGDAAAEPSETPEPDVPDPDASADAGD